MPTEYNQPPRTVYTGGESVTPLLEILIDTLLSSLPSVNIFHDAMFTSANPWWSYHLNPSARAYFSTELHQLNIPRSTKLVLKDQKENKRKKVQTMKTLAKL